MVTKNDALDIFLNQGYNYYSKAGDLRLAYTYENDFWESLTFTQVDIEDTVPGTKRVQTNQINGDSTEWVPYLMVFRAPSEHTFEGRHMDLELQFTHRNPEDFNP